MWNAWSSRRWSRPLWRHTARVTAFALVAVAIMATPGAPASAAPQHHPTVQSVSYTTTGEIPSLQRVRATVAGAEMVPARTAGVVIPARRQADAGRPTPMLRPVGVGASSRAPPEDVPIG